MDIESFKKHPIYGLLTSAADDIDLQLIIAIANDQIKIGSGEKSVRILVPENSQLPQSTSEFALGKAYVEGQFDIQGDLAALLELRHSLTGKSNWLVQLGFLRDLFIRNTRIVNKDSIAKHYTFGDEFYLNFIDTAFRFYSHCLFKNDDETLEQAAKNKLESLMFLRRIN